MAGVTKVDFGLHSDANTRWLSPVIQKWAFAITKYTETTEYAGYYFNERANIGFLAAGAWLAGRVSLEEYPDMKTHTIAAKRPGKTGRPRTVKKSGRVDLYLNDGKTDAIFEAKMLWGEAGHADMKKRLQDAEKDAKKDRGADRNYACVFYAPHFPKKGRKGGVTNSEIGAEIERVRAQSKPHLLAWCFPKKARKIRGGGIHSKSYYPGVILAVSVVR